jgi:outer membrane receptor for ferrienterochelin and colicins
VASKGLAQRTYTARGSRSASSGSFLTLVDGRDQTIPSIAFNIPYLVPSGSADVDHIEVVRGPAGAMYGPNTERGVVQLITRSPFDAPGTTLSVAAGGRDLWQGELRQAGVAGPRLGYKVTGEYLSGTDWVYPDTTGMVSRDSAVAQGRPDSLRINNRDPQFARYALGGQVEWRTGPHAAIQAGVGYANATSAVDLEPTLGPIQLSNWGFGNAHAEYTHNAMLGRISYSWNNSGDSYSLWHGNQLVDFSTMLVAQLKAGSALRHGGSIQYGADLRNTNPITNGTIDGRNEDNDQVTEIGAFVLGDLPVGEQVTLSAALRADYHDRIGTVALAPRLGIVYQPTPTQAVRLTYGRGYTTPAPTDFFADIQVERNPYFPAYISGVPPGGGYQFGRTCGGLCMRSPFNPEGAAALQPIDVTVYWNVVVAGLLANGIDLTGVPAPTAAEVGSVLRLLDANSGTFGSTPVSAASVEDYPTEKRETTDAIELGYKAALGSRWGLGVSAAYSYTRNFFGASTFGTPGVFFDHDQLEAYLAPFVGQAAAGVIADSVYANPLGIVTPVNSAYPTAFLDLRHQGGSFSRVGVDFELSYRVAAGLMVAGNYSWVNRDSIGSAGGSDMAVLSAPRNKGAATISYQAPGSWWGVWGQGLAVETFPVKSGVFVGTIPGYAVLNLGATMAVPGRRELSIAVTATNVLDKVHQEYVGAPAIGRLVIVRLEGSF